MTHTTGSPLVDAVQQRIRDALRSSAALDARQITVDVDGPCVVLEGTVRSWAEHEDVERAVLSTPGVTRVDNRLALLVKAKLAAHSRA